MPHSVVSYCMDFDVVSRRVSLNLINVGCRGLGTMR